MSRIIVCGVAALALGACANNASPNPPPPPPPASVAAPLLVADLPIPPNYGIHDTFVRDGIAFVCAWNTGLILLDVGNGVKGGTPSRPVEISRIVPSDNGVPGGPAVHNAWWFWNPVSGEHRYVFLGQEGPATLPVASTGDLHVIDVADLSQPREVAFYHMNGPAPAGSHNVWMDEAAQVLFAAFYNGGVVALDVSGTLSGDLAGRELARIRPAADSYIWGVQLAGGSVYATDLLNGLYQLHFAGGAFSVTGGGANVLDRYTSDLAVIGGFAYTGTWGAAARQGAFGNVIKVWRLAADGAPVLADSIVLDGVVTVGDVKASADAKLLVASGDKGDKGGIYLYSLSNPGHPVLIAAALISGGVHTARLADIGGRRYIFAAKNPGDPVAPALLIYDVTGLIP